MLKRKKFSRVVPDEIKVVDLRIEDVTCGATKCDEGYHCYSKKRSSLRKYGEQRVCKQCGTDLIDWKRIHKNDLNDSDFVFESLRTEIIRHVFWHNPIQWEALYGTYLNGKILTRAKARKLLKTRIAKYNNYFDGRQTPMGKEEIVNYAQHATATCCRQCLEAWHNIKMEKPLTEKELEFCTDLVMKYIVQRVEGLTDDPQDEKLAKKLANEHSQH
jgi:hypothetical protein